MQRKNRLLNQIFQNPEFLIDKESLGYLVRDIINMNWWNTSGVLIGYRKNKRISAPFTETQKRLAVQLKEFYRIDKLSRRNETKLRGEIRRYLSGATNTLSQLSYHSMPVRANPSQYFHAPDGEMTWVDCTSRATYAAKYVFQNGFIDFDGKCRLKDGHKITNAIYEGKCHDLGISDFFVSGENGVKAEIFSQKESQLTVREWVEKLAINVLAERKWLLSSLGHVRTDPYKKFEEIQVLLGITRGVNERLYGFGTSASHASDASDASDASRASDASHASSASDAGCTGFTGKSWAECKTAITKSDGLEYPKEFRSGIFAIAGNWKINKAVAALAKRGWFDPFSGHGTSPLFAKRNGIRYLGFDPNTRAFDEYLSIVVEECKNAPGPPVRVINADSTQFRAALVGQFDLCYTSPPYFNFEEYGGNTAHYVGLNSYEEFHAKITVPVLKNVFQYLIPGGVLALQTETDKAKRKLWEKVVSEIGFVHVSSGATGGEAEKYSSMSKRDQSLLIFKRPSKGK